MGTSTETAPAKALAGKTAIVTGSGRNIGKAIALHFATAGANVIVNGHRNQDALDAVVGEIRALGGKALACLCDVGDPASVNEMVRTAESAFGPVTIAVSNVAARKHRPFLETTLDDWNGTLNTNLNSAYYLAQAVLPAMREAKWGRIIHISGEDAFAANMPGRAVNIVAKAGMHALTKALATEFATEGITANTVSPGYIDTERDWSKYPENPQSARIGQIPMRRLGAVEDIASACVYLAGASGAFVTGQVLHVNGGQFLY
jgi:NAD(P)-dependent dehydrogenase (short-subunit alcohol dehydrogenase family)